MEDEAEDESVEVLLAKVIDTNYRDDNSYSECIRAIIRLGELREVRVVEPILKLLSGEDFDMPWIYENQLPYMSEHLLRTLEKVGEPGVPQLCEAFEEWAPFRLHRKEMAELLQRIGSSLAEETAMKLLDSYEYDQSSEIRQSGAWLLGFIGTRKCVSKLKKAARWDKSECVQEVAEQALARLVERKVDSSVQPEA